LEKDYTKKDFLEIVEMKDFWNNTATRFGMGNNLRSVLHPSSRGLLNLYTNFIQKQALIKTFRSLRGKTVLDVGCGIGRWTTMLAKSGSITIGIDLSKQMLKNAQHRSIREKTHAQFVLASATQLPFADQIFDSILSVTVLQHITNEILFRSAVVDILRTTKKGGNIILLEYNSETMTKQNQFPTVAYDYQEYFENKGNAHLIEVQGVDLSLFLKPLNRIARKRGKYKDRLKGKPPSSKYALSAAIFYFFVSLGCLCSLPFDITFRNVLKSYSEHKIHIFRVNNSQSEKGRKVGIE
jgi:ubiquinone/menaquinone biosynthesis C-methylase UbiE